MRRLAPATTIIAAAFMAGGCASHNFLVYKDGSNFFITQDLAVRQQLLCDSGDIDRVITDSGLSSSLQLRIKAAICSTTRAKKDMRQILEEMTYEQLNALKNAFRKAGYEINKPLDA